MLGKCDAMNKDAGISLADEYQMLWSITMLQERH